MWHGSSNTPRHDDSTVGRDDRPYSGSRSGGSDRDRSVVASVVRGRGSGRPVIRQICYRCGSTVSPSAGLLVCGSCGRAYSMDGAPLLSQDLHDAHVRAYWYHRPAPWRSLKDLERPTRCRVCGGRVVGKALRDEPDGTVRRTPDGLAWVMWRCSKCEGIYTSTVELPERW